MKIEKIQNECTQWNDKEGNARYYLNRWSKYIESIHLDFAGKQIACVTYNDTVMPVDDFKAIKVWFNKDYTLHVKCAVSQELKAEIEDRIGEAFGSDVASVTITGQTALPMGNNNAEINEILDMMERNCLDVNIIMDGIRKIRGLTK